MASLRGFLGFACQAMATIRGPLSCRSLFLLKSRAASLFLFCLLMSAGPSCEGCFAQETELSLSNEIKSSQILLSSEGTDALKAIVAFYNVENLYDTIPSLFYDDQNYTPKGRLRWNTERYQTKLENIARVITDLNPDILGLCEVENKTVLADLIEVLADDYNYVHLTGNDRRGMDVALLYKGDKFFPDESRLVGAGAGRDFLYIRGELFGCRVDLIVCHLPSRMNRSASRSTAINSLFGFADSLQRSDAKACPLIMGDFNTMPSDRVLVRAAAKASLKSVLTGHWRKGMGSYHYGGRWQLIDNIFMGEQLLAKMNGEVMTKDIAGGSAVLTQGIKVESAGIFIRKYIVDASGVQGGMPLRTFTRGAYTAGFSDHLPVYVVISVN